MRYHCFTVPNAQYFAIFFCYVQCSYVNHCPYWKTVKQPHDSDKTRSDMFLPKLSCEIHAEISQMKSSNLYILTMTVSLDHCFDKWMNILNSNRDCIYLQSCKITAVKIITIKVFFSWLSFVDSWPWLE